jgi:hypothetical protein
MMTSKLRALSSLAVALTFVGAATLVQAQEGAISPPAAEAGAAASSISKPASSPSAAVSSRQADHAAAAAIDNPRSAATGAHITSPASAVAAKLAAPVTNSPELSALHDPLLHKKLNAVLTKLTPERVRLNKEYAKAAAIFPAFCKDWEQKLHDREANNLSHLLWKVENGFETALYTGYSRVESCEAHQSPQGFSIGKLTYEEYKFRIQGKTPDEAKHTKATAVDDTHTTEIFRWDKGKWFY